MASPDMMTTTMLIPRIMMNDRIKVLLDNGHGIDTAGKRSPDGKLREYDWNRKTANVTLSILKERGVDVELVVPEITDIPLSERSLRANAIAKAFGASNVVYVSVHVNAAGNSHQWMKARGWSVFVYNKPSSKMDESPRMVCFRVQQAIIKGGDACQFPI